LETEKIGGGQSELIFLAISLFDLSVIGHWLFGWAARFVYRFSVGLLLSLA
jgi:hypothetical protein